MKSTAAGTSIIMCRTNGNELQDNDILVMIDETTVLFSNIYVYHDIDNEFHLEKLRGYVGRSRSQQVYSVVEAIFLSVTIAICIQVNRY